MPYKVTVSTSKQDEYVASFIASTAQEVEQEAREYVARNNTEIDGPKLKVDTPAYFVLT